MSPRPIELELIKECRIVNIYCTHSNFCIFLCFLCLSVCFVFAQWSKLKTTKCKLNDGYNLLIDWKCVWNYRFPQTRTDVIAYAMCVIEVNGVQQQKRLVSNNICDFFGNNRSHIAICNRIFQSTVVSQSVSQSKKLDTPCIVS